MKLGTFIITLLFLAPAIFYGQADSSYNLSGIVVDGTTNNPLTGAHLITTNKSGTKTLNDGTFNINCTYKDTLWISYIGFKTIQYIIPKNEPGRYLTKFKLYKDSITLDEVEIFPYPTYKEFKEAFIALDKQDEKLQIKGVKTYVDKITTPYKPSILNPASFIYDKLFDKKAKLKRRLDKYRKTIRKDKSD